MYLRYVILVLLLLMLWIYIIIIVRNRLVENTSVEVNIVDHSNKNILESINVRRNKSSKNEDGKQVTRKIINHVPKFMLELYEKNKSMQKDGARADLVRSLIPTEAEKLQDNDVLEELSENHLLIFEIPNSAKHEKIIGAELKILTKIEICSKQDKGVSRILKIFIYNEFSKTYSHIQEIQIHHFNDTWLSFNLIKEVKEILDSNLDTKFLKIVISIIAFYHQSENYLKLSLLPSSPNVDHDYPVLLLSYSIESDQDESKSRVLNKEHFGVTRKRRNIEEDYEEETSVIWNSEISKKTLKKIRRNNCRRRPLYIDFAEINYNSWIVQPTGYDAYQCQGRCFYPVADHLSPTKHAIMQALIHSVNPLKASRSCCVPTALDPISILYVDDRGVLTYRYAYRDMVVLECGCR